MSEQGETAVSEPSVTNWRDGVTEANRSGVTKFETVDSLAQGYLELEKSMGARVKMPGEDTPQEEKSAFYRKLGAPETMDGYSLPELPEGKSYDEALLGSIRQAAHAEGVTDKQFGKLTETFIAMQAKTEEAQQLAEQQETAATDQVLHDEWGAEYDKNVEISKRAMRELVPEELRGDFEDLLIKHNLDNNAIFIKGFQSIGAQMMDDTMVKGEPAPKPDGDYLPANINSPEMYRNGEDDESKKARAYFTGMGFKY